MGVAALALADPEIAGATLRAHLDDLWASGRLAEQGWGRIELDLLSIVVALPGHRASGERDWYFVRLGADYYDAAPPTALLVDPSNWRDAPYPSRWFPVINNRPSWFGLHHAYKYPDGRVGQLICFSHVAQYYQTDHSPGESERWQQGRHTVSATLTRLAQMLKQPHYEGPSA